MRTCPTSRLRGATTLAAFLVALAALTGCRTISSARTPSFEGSVSYASSVWFRGRPGDDEGGLQGDMNVGFENKEGDRLGLFAWGSNLDVSSALGDKVFPDGNGRWQSEVDFTADYTRDAGNVRVGGGLTNLNFPFGFERTTNEVFGSVSWDMLGVSQAVKLHYDFEEAQDFYASLETGTRLRLGRSWWLDLQVLLGFMSEDQAEFYFGASESGWADLQAHSSLVYSIDKYTHLSLAVRGLEIVDQDLQRALDESGRDAHGLAVTLGFGFSF